jgi:hypothetical protein
MIAFKNIPFFYILLVKLKQINFIGRDKLKITVYILITVYIYIYIFYNNYGKRNYWKIA